MDALLGAVLSGWLFLRLVDGLGAGAARRFAWEDGCGLQTKDREENGEELTEDNGKEETDDGWDRFRCGAGEKGETRKVEGELVAVASDSA